MKFYALIAFLPLVASFAPTEMMTRTRQTNLAMVSRRDALFGVISVATLVASPKASSAGTANPQFEEEVNFQPQQMVTGDKTDVNGAIVADYKQFPGFYPHAAGKIASNGPYSSVKDIYNIPGITANDKKLFKKYEKELVALPPGRMFDERINQRQST